MTTDQLPLFSIVTITYNNRAGLAKTAASVGAQICKDFEWIIVDGLSDDGTADDLPAYPARITREKDGGIYDAMNKGIAAARGRYTIFMNAGDCFSDPDILATLSKSIAAHDPDFIYGDALEDDGRYKKARNPKWIFYGMFTHHQAMIYKTALLKDFLYDTRYKIAGDYDLTVRFLRCAHAVHYCPAALCIFESGGVSQRNMRQGRIEQFIARKKLGVCGMILNTAVYTAQSVTARMAQGRGRQACSLPCGVH